jgi:hypothetical protein
MRKDEYRKHDCEIEREEKATVRRDLASKIVHPEPTAA